MVDHVYRHYIAVILMLLFPGSMKKRNTHAACVSDVRLMVDHVYHHYIAVILMLLFPGSMKKRNTHAACVSDVRLMVDHVYHHYIAVILTRSTDRRPCVPSLYSCNIDASLSRFHEEEEYKHRVRKRRARLIVDHVYHHYIAVILILLCVSDALV